MTQQENIGAIWESVNAGLKSFIASKIRNKAEADDLLQDLYLKIHANIGSLKSTDKIRPWIYRIARNLIADHYRDRARAMTKQEPLTLIKSGSSPGKFMVEAINDMISMMDDLPPEYCEALCLTEFEGMSQKEYALKLGISYSGAKSRVQRARLMLRDMLLKCCHYQFDKYGTVFGIQPAGCCCCAVRK